MYAIKPAWQLSSFFSILAFPNRLAREVHLMVLVVHRFSFFTLTRGTDDQIYVHESI